MYVFQQIREIFRTYAKNLEKIAHLMAPDLHKFLDQESQVKLFIYQYFISLHYV